MEYNFDGISMDKINKEALNNNFNCIWDDNERTVYLSKETYDQGEEDPEYNFNYKYFIIKDLIDFDEKPMSVRIGIELVPAIESIHPDKLKDLAEEFGIEVEDITYQDLSFGDYGIILSYEDVPIKDESEWDSKKVNKKLNIAANCVNTINSLRGFFIDKKQNLVGLTGWNYIYQLTRNENFKDQLNRIMKEREEQQND